MGQRKDLFLDCQKLEGDGGTATGCIEGYGVVYPYGWDGEPVASPIDTAT